MNIARSEPARLHPVLLCNRSSLHGALFFVLLTLMRSGPSVAQTEESGAVVKLSSEALATMARESVVVVNYFGRDGTEEGVGAGVVVGTNGLIATCLHVIGEARPIRVRLRDGSRHEVTEIHAWDRNLDLALIRIDAPGLKPLPLGDSALLNQGAPVVAIGNPLGLEHSIVQGVVSARRDFDGQEMLQLAIPIEPGNSGGPLLDMKGRIQGLINMKSAMSRNLGFAIPIDALKPLLDKPNPVPMARWLTIGALNPKDWEPLMGSRWSRSSGRILVEDFGSGFGGRSLCLARRVPPDRPFELTVKVKLADETGAAGLVFGSDGDQRHYGFYPTGGRLRLTRFDGPDVFAWTILDTVPSDHYKPGEWNTLKVRWGKDGIRCYVNGQLVIESNDDGLPNGRVGLAKFRDTKAEFKSFRFGSRLEEDPPALSPELAARLDALVDDIAGKAEVAPSGGLSAEAQVELLAGLTRHPEVGRAILEDRAKRLETQAAVLRLLARRVHDESVQQDLADIVNEPTGDIDLFHAALLVAKLDHADLDVEGYREHLDEMAQEVVASLAAEASPSDRRRALVRYLFEENGFHGSRHEYYHQANSQMDRVIDDREGLPITLSVLFIELAARIGLEGVEGVPLPGHFIVRHNEGEGDGVLLDVFEGGRTLSRADVESLVRLHTGARFREAYLVAATKKDIITRMLRNLHGVAEREDALDRELKYLDALLALSPDSPSDRFMRAGKRLRARDVSGARTDMKWLLDHEPAGINLEALAELYNSLGTAP